MNKDSTFILEAVRYLYKEDLSVLLGKTLKGRPERTEFKDGGMVKLNPSKDPLTPEKVKRIEQLFIDRVTKSNTKAVDHGERIKPTYINKLIASAISNITKKFKSSDKRNKASNDHIDL